jgi:hypothetical protein
VTVPEINPGSNRLAFQDRPAYLLPGRLYRLHPSESTEKDDLAEPFENIKKPQLGQRMRAFARNLSHALNLGRDYKPHLRVLITAPGKCPRSPAQ